MSELSLPIVVIVMVMCTVLSGCGSAAGLRTMAVQGVCLTAGVSTAMLKNHTELAHELLHNPMESFSLWSMSLPHLYSPYEIPAAVITVMVAVYLRRQNVTNRYPHELERCVIPIVRGSEGTWEQKIRPFGAGAATPRRMSARDVEGIDQSRERVLQDLDESSDSDMARLVRSKRELCSLLAGGGFAGGVVLSGLANPSKVAAFFDFLHANGFDPSIGIALSVAFLSYVAASFFVRSIWKLPYWERFWPVVEEQEKERHRVSPKLLLGSALLGMGWAVGGVGVASGLVGAFTGAPYFLVWMGSMSAAMLLCRTTAALGQHWRK